MFIKESLLAPDQAGRSLRMKCDSCCNRILPKTEGVNQTELTKKNQLLRCEYVKTYLILIDILLLVLWWEGKAPVLLIQ